MDSFQMNFTTNESGSQELEMKYIQNYFLIAYSHLSLTKGIKEPCTIYDLGNINSGNGLDPYWYQAISYINANTQ